MIPQAETPWTIFEAAHLLNRAGFGGNPAEVKALHARGRQGAVDFLVSPPEPETAFPLPSWSVDEAFIADERERVQKRRALQVASRNMTPAEAEQAKRESNRQFRQQDNRRTLEAQGWWFARMLRSKAPLREKMTLFWHDHFATSVQKVRQPALIVRQNELFRQHAFGSAKALTQEILMNPAMMLYLDSQSSRKDKPNENFPRELMELFTLGEGNYTEEDVHEAARAMTGYRLDRTNGKVTHNKRNWDSSPKTIFKQTGRFDGSDVIELIFEKSETAQFITRKIWEFFAYENPPDTLVAALAASWQASGFEMRPLLRAIFLSQEFYAESTLRSQIKSPVQYLVALLKQLEIAPPLGLPVAAGRQLGQTLFAPPNVAGWDWGKAWINTNSLLTRYNLAGTLTKGSGVNPAGPASKAMGKLARRENRAKNANRAQKGPDYEKIAPRSLRENPEDLIDSLIFRFFQAPLPYKARESFIGYAATQKGAVLTNKETAELCHLILSTPYYQLC